MWNNNCSLFNKVKKEMRSSEEIASLELVQALFMKSNISSKLSTGQYDKYDIITENNWRIEVKNRKLSKSDFIKYNNGGFILEEIKYSYLIQFNNSRYINVFHVNGLTFILNWKIKDVRPIINDLYCRKTTHFENTNRVRKSVIYLKAETALIYLYEDNDFKKIDFNTLIDKLN